MSVMNSDSAFVYGRHGNCVGLCCYARVTHLVIRRVSNHSIWTACFGLFKPSGEALHLLLSPLFIPVSLHTHSIGCVVNTPCSLNLLFYCTYEVGGLY